MGLRLGRYETTERLAAGGMATVYLGRAVGEGGFERLVAIKVMHEHVAAEVEFRAMFLDEARLAARIRHPNVVGVLDIQKTDEDQLFLVMEFIDGPSLFQLRRKLAEMGDRLPIEVTLRIFVDALTGLHGAHDLTGDNGALLHVVHRDISPQNILVGRDGITRITDFGVARAEERITSTRGGQLKGKVAYMPPEQIRNEDVDRRADVYGAGVALWEALTGKRLFEAQSEAALVHMILGGVGRSPNDVDATVPQAISDVCMRALSFNRDARPATAADFADALEEAARKEGIEVASARKVAAFVASLPQNVLARPGTTTATAPAMRVPPAATPTRAPAPAIENDERRNRATVPELPSPLKNESTTTRSIVTTNDPIVLPKRSRMPLVLGGVVVVAAGLGFAAWRLAGPQAPASRSTPAATTEAAATSEPTSVTTATATATATAAVSAAPAETTTASASVTATSTASVAVESATTAPSSKPPAGTLRPPVRPPTTTTKPPVGVGYDPDRL